jgi:hypothetical protein
MTALPAFDAMVDDFARAAATAPRRWRGRRWLALPAVLGAIAVTGAAFAATGALLTGEPARPAPHPRPLEDPRESIAIVPSSVQLADARVADPDGGPPWGVRTMRTATGNLCAQVGRLVDGRIGVIGFDGRFHDLPLRADVASVCDFHPGPPGGRPRASRAGARVRGDLYVPPRSTIQLDSSGRTLREGCADGPDAGTIVLCDTLRSRRVAWGILRPDVRELRVDGRHVAAEPDRSYLFLSRAGEGNPAVAAILPDGRTPALVHTGRPPPAKPGHRVPAAPAHFEPAVGGRRSTFILTWRAPARAKYWIYSIRGPGGTRCDRTTVLGSVDGRATAVVRKFAPPGPPPVGWCPGDYRGEIRYGRAAVAATFRFTVR